MQTVKNIIREYKIQLTENKYSLPLVKLSYYFLNVLQNVTTVTGHTRILLYALKKNQKLKSFVSFWVLGSFVISIFGNIFFASTLQMVAFNYFRVYEIFLINFWMFVFRQGATKATGDIQENDIRLFLLLFVQYFTVIFCFSGLYYSQCTVNPLAFNQPELINYIDFVYFSFVTITTLGYGEIFPCCTTTKLLVCIELLAGMLFILLFITTILSKIKFDWRSED